MVGGDDVVEGHVPDGFWYGDSSGL
jgi:hypothetical protein